MSGFRDDEQMDECNAALVLMSLSGSPHSPRPWMLGSSPASNSSGSWTSCSEELSDEGMQHRHLNDQSDMRSNMNNNNKCGTNTTNTENNRLRTASLSTSDEGIVMDYNDETSRKRQVSSMDSFSLLRTICSRFIIKIYLLKKTFAR